ncbi:MAG: MATE family efflux transporter [Bacilli bacterium]|nr:MATE family efflux transporter [Bacilli bacterium]
MTVEKDNISIKTLLKLTIPVFLELILQVLLGNVDKIMVRNDASANAINQANSIIDMLTVSISVLAAGSLILINQYKGAGNKRAENKIYSIAFYFTLVLSFILGIVLLIFGPSILRLMNVSSSFFEETLIYLRINGGFLFLQAIILTLSAFLRSNMFMIHGFIVSATINVLNVGLNALFLYVFNIPGVMGVGIATIISRIIGCIILLILVKKLVKIKLSFKEGMISVRKELTKLLKISIPSAGESFSYSLSQIVILSIINIIGLTMIAAPTAKTYANIMVQFSFIFTSSITQAMQIMLGRALGARNTVLAEKMINKTLVLAIGSSLLISFIQALFAKPIFSLFTKDVEVIKLCSYIMWIEVGLELGRAINITLVRALQTSGDVLFPTILAVVFCWSVAVVGSYIFGVVLNLGIVGVWIAMTIDELIRALIFIIRLKKGKWKNINLVSNVIIN